MTTRRFFSANYLIVGLLIATGVMQVSILYRQSVSRTPTSQRSIRQAPKGSTIEIAGMPALGSNDARVVVVEFSDYECPFCRKHATTVFEDLKNEFVTATGQIKYAFANNPLAIHPNAVFLATAALCAGDQGHYWMLHDRLFSEQPSTQLEVLSIVEESEIDVAAFKRCVASESVGERVRRDVQVAEKLGLLGTPAFAVGRLAADGLIEVETLISGAQPLATFQGVLKKML